MSTVETQKYTASPGSQSAPDFQAWLERAPWRTIRGTKYGRRDEEPDEPPLSKSDLLIDRIYKLDVATFLTAEKVSYENIAKLVQYAPDEASQVFLITQAADEARHFEVFCNCLSDRGLTPDQRNDLMDSVTSPELRKFYDLIHEQVDRGDFPAAMLAHNVVLEGMAYPVYRYESAYWSRFDPDLTRMIRGAFADEVHHVRYGERIIEQFCKPGEASRNRMLKLAGEFHKLLTEVFEAAIEHYIHLYQIAANQHRQLVSDIEIFPGKLMGEVDEKTQVRILLAEIQREHQQRLERIGLA